MPSSEASQDLLVRCTTCGKSLNNDQANQSSGDKSKRTCVCYQYEFKTKQEENLEGKQDVSQRDKGSEESEKHKSHVQVG